MPRPDGYMTPPEFAKAIGVDERSVRRYFEEGRFHDAFRSDSGRIWIANSELEGWTLASAPQSRVQGVYFAQAENGPIRIGHSTDVLRRLAAIQADCPVDVRLLVTLREAPPDLAEKIRVRFDGARIRGKWFKPIPSLLALIDQVRTGHTNPDN